MLRDLLGLSKEPLETGVSEAAEKFKQEKEKEMDAAEQKAEAIRADVIQEFEDLEGSLKDLKEFEDEKDRQVINDVVDNIITDRIEMVEGFSSTENPEELYSKIDDFIEDFQSLTQKEAAVLEEAYLQKKVSKTVGGLEDQRERLSDFLESEYSAVNNYNELNELLDHRDSLLDEINELKGSIEQLKVEELTAEVEDIESQLSDLKESSKWNDYEYLQSEVKQKKSEKKQLISDIKTSLSKMERGLKKLIYQSKNGDLSVTKVNVLENLRDKNTEYILDNPGKTAEALEEARESLPDELLNDRQQKKFLESIEEVEGLSRKSDRIKSLESEAEELENQIEDHSVIEEKDELESERRAMQKHLREERDQRDNLEKQVEEKRAKVEETEDLIQEVMEDSFDREVKFD